MPRLIDLKREAEQFYSLALDWNDAQCAESYKVTIKKLVVKQGKKVKKVLETGTPSLSQYTTAKVLKKGNYFWSVQACNDVGCTNSNTFKFKIK